MAFHTTATRLLVWRDALPASYEPLLPLPHFGSHAPGFPTLAADLSLLSGLDPGRSVVVAGLLTAGLLLIGLYGLLATRLRPWAAALGALLGLATAPWPRFLAVWGEGGPLLALALGLSAATLLMGHSSRPSAVAAGMLLGAGLLAQPVLTLGVGLAIAAGVAWEGKGRADMRRLALAGTVALVLAGPALVRLGRALSSREALGVLKAVQGREVMSFVTGLALVGLAGLLAHLLTQARPRSRVLPGVLVAVSAGILLVGAHAGPAAGQLEPAYLRSLARLEADARPLDAVCAGPEVLDWVPALGGRRPAHAGKETPEPWIPHPLRDEWSQAPGADCSKMLDPPAPRRSQPLTSGRGTPAEALRITH
jgi:hypothetical protein